MEREEEEEMREKREKRSLQRWRGAQSAAHPSGGTSPWIRRLRHPPCADGSHEPVAVPGWVIPGSAGLGVPERNQSSGSSGIPAWMVSPSPGRDWSGD